jgi:hypothetical protein
MTPWLGRSSHRLGVAALLVVAVAGCGGPELDGARLVATLRAQLEAKGVVADDLSCPGGLPAEVGRSVRCSFTVGGQPVDAVATVSSVEGATVGYDVRTEARPVRQEVLERSLVAQLGPLGVPAGTPTCAGDLPAQVGATVGCRLSGPDTTTEWTVRTTAVDGGKVDYAIEQAGLT